MKDVGGSQLRLRIYHSAPSYLKKAIIEEAGDATPMPLDSKEPHDPLAIKPVAEG